MLPQSTQTGGVEYNEAKITTFNGLDRISSALFLESQAQALFYFPFIATPLLFALNVVDDETGAINKRGGFPLYLDNPDGLPVTTLIQFTNFSSSGSIQQLRISGPNIYIYNYSGNSWGTPKFVFPSGQTLRLRNAHLNGFEHLSNGIDELMFYDGNHFYPVGKFGSQTTTLQNNVVGSLQTVLASPIVSGATSFSINDNVLATLTTAYLTINPNGNTSETVGVLVTGSSAPYTCTLQAQIGPSAIKNNHNSGETVQPSPLPAPTSTILSVSDTSKMYPFFGFVQIDNEYMKYTALSQAALYSAAAAGSTSITLTGVLLQNPLPGYIIVDLWGADQETVHVTAVTQSGSQYVYTVSALAFNHAASVACQADEITVPDYGRGYYSSILPHSTGATVNVVFGQSGSVPPNPKLLLNVANRLWAANTNETGGSSAIYISASRGNPWDSLDWFLDYIPIVNTSSGSSSTSYQLDPSGATKIYIDPENGQQITSMREINGSVYITKEQSTYLVSIDQYGNPVKIDKLSSQYGAPVNEAVLAIDNNLISLNSFGIVASNGSSPILQSYNISDLIQGINPANLSLVYGKKFNFKYYFSVGSITTAPWVDPVNGSSTIENCIIVFNYLTNGFFLYTTPFTVNCFEEMYSQTDALGHLDLFAGDTVGNTYIYNSQTFSDNGMDIPITIQTRYFFFKDPATSKEFNRTTVICENGTNASIYYSLIGDEALPYQFIMTLPNYVNRHDFPDNDQMWHGIAYKIVESSSSRFRLTGIIQEYEHTFRIVGNMI